MSDNGAQFYDEGYYYYKGCNGYPLNYTKAFDLFTRAAECGNSDAMNSLGLMYENGEGTLKDISLMLYWYRKAAEMNNSYALYHLGRCYIRGEGVEEDYNKALELMLKSYSINPLELVSLKIAALYFELGDGKNAYKYSAKVIKSANEPYYFYMMGMLIVNGYTPAKKHIDCHMLAYEYFEKAAKSGMAEGMYEFGRTIIVLDFDKKREYEARRWIEKSAKMGYAPAQKLYRLMRFKSFL